MIKKQTEVDRETKERGKFSSYQFVKDVEENDNKNIITADRVSSPTDGYK